MLNQDACYAAIERRDPAFDGVFFTAVKTTRIYCRPVCPARTPLRRNVIFYPHAAQAQDAGFRPCLRCRPESAPDSPAWIGSLASVNRALRRIDEGDLASQSVEQLAESLGMTGRHLRRLFLQHLGATPLAMEQARRIHLAKTLLHQTRLPMTEIAYASGFASLRRFNEAFQDLFGRPPTAVRREGGEDAAAGAAIRLKLTWRPPFDWSGRLSDRASAGLSAEETVVGGVYRLALREGGEVRVQPGAGRTLDVEITGAPVRELARLLAHLKRDLIHPAADPAVLERMAA